MSRKGLPCGAGRHHLGQAVRDVDRAQRGAGKKWWDESGQDYSRAPSWSRTNEARLFPPFFFFCFFFFFYPTSITATPCDMRYRSAWQGPASSGPGTTRIDGKYRNPAWSQPARR